MSDPTRITEPDLAAFTERPPLVALPGGGEGIPDPADADPPRSKPKIRWLRLIMLLSGLGLLAIVSTVFGMMMAVASDLPRLDVFHVEGHPSVVVDRRGKPLGELTGNTRRKLVQSADISPVMKQAIVAIEDRRFNTNSGIDFRGIARALYQDVVQRRIVQGGSTITQQLVKNRLEAANDRTLFQKLREAAIAVHMTREWDKPRILTNYLNTIYFGNGAYGIEAAAQTYFGKLHGCGAEATRSCASQLDPHEAALIAGIVASPSAYDPIAHPAAATKRRNLVIQRMTEQGYLSRSQAERAMAEPIPTRIDITPPQEQSEVPYFTTWVRQQVVDKVGNASAAFEGGLVVKTTLDKGLQAAAENAVRQWMPNNNAGPSASLVAIDNEYGEVLAMVGGPLPTDPTKPWEPYNTTPFNLATQGQRQPGSAFKPFVLAQALRRGVKPDSVWSSKKKAFCVTRRKDKCREWFEVNNYEDNYAGVLTLANATAHSDNAVYAEVGVKTGGRYDKGQLRVDRIANLARRMGIRTPISDNPAITLGGLAEGVTVLDMAHAYQTIAQNGRLTYGTLTPGVDLDGDVQKGIVPGPVGVREIRRVTERDENGRPIEDEPYEVDGEKLVNEKHDHKVLDYGVAQQMKGMLAGVVKFGTGRRAALGKEDVLVMGKTGTTENYGDAWFVGFTDKPRKGITVAVWVGFPDEVKAMEPGVFDFQGDPVAGGTYPAAIWQSFMKSALAVYKARAPKKKDDEDPGEVPTPGGPVQNAPSPTPTTTAPSGQGGRKPKPQQQAEPEPEAEQEAAPAPEAEAQPQEPPPATGEGGAEPPPEDGAGFLP